MINKFSTVTSPQPPPKEGVTAPPQPSPKLRLRSVSKGRERLPFGQLGKRQCKFVQTFWRSMFPSFGGVRGGEFGGFLNLVNPENLMKITVQTRGLRIKSAMMSAVTLAIICLFTISSCHRNEKAARTDTPTSGEAMIASDECLEPIVREELAVFTGLNLQASIEPIFASERDVFKLLLSDSIRLIIAARDLTDNEKQQIKRFKLTPRSQKIATDGIALIINKDNTDSLLSMKDLQKIVTGEILDWNAVSASDNKKERPIIVVFDQQNSSTLRFINDSICRGKPLGSHLVAAASNQEVLNYVAKHPNAMGVIGVNWISNPNDSTKLSFDNTIRVMSLSRETYPTEDNSYKPFPAYLATGDYPLTRDIYAIISDVRGGLPSGFVTFLAGDSGQRIILKAGLVPATRPTRLINLKSEF